MDAVNTALEVGHAVAETAWTHLNQFLEQFDTTLLTLFVALLAYVYTNFMHMHHDEIGIRRRLWNKMFSTVKRIPQVKSYINKELNGVTKDLATSLQYKESASEFVAHLPESGLGADELVRLSDVYDHMEEPMHLDGRVSGAIFSDEADQEEMRAYTEVFRRFAWSNPLWPKLFPGVRKMEAEVIRMCCNMMNGDAETCGTMSTGGSISILLACLAHRNRLLRQGVKYPQMIVPTSAHAAFTKAAEVFRIKFVRIPVDPVTYKVDLKKMEAAITKRTCMLVGSAPNFPFGTVDDIKAIGQLGLKYDIPVHVDACLGGFLLPFIDSKYDYDFRTPGVTSISADSHKYGLAPKGSSVVLYRNNEYLHNQYFCDTDWQGGIYASATLEGSRAGMNIALCWAAMLYHGRDGYERHAEAIVRTTKAIRDGLKTIPGLRLQGESEVCIVSWTTEDSSLLARFHEQMSRKKWQLTSLQFPTGCHIMVTMNHTGPCFVDRFIEDCRHSMLYVLQTPGEVAKGDAAIYGMAQRIPDRSIVSELAYKYLDTIYSDTSRPRE